MASNFNAKKKFVENMIDDGYYVKVPKEFRWHQSQKNDKDFLDKLN